ncbi:MAG: glycoside hydrolase family 3 N-terminal domain-containing protein [Bacteroidia bacterium]|nr:glycoside hydrolase family 3 N-terminal domain-containing protein [Bacteroidia bacterium]
MKSFLKYLYHFLIVLIFIGCNHSKNQDKASINIDEIMSKMSVKDKIGQMTQLNLDVISVGEVFNLKEPHELDSTKLRKAIVEYGIGSILNAGGHAYTLEHWNEVISTIQNIATTETNHGVPIIYGIDAIHGANYLLGGTLFPQPLAQAATFNPNMVRKAAAITAYETRASGIPWNFSPVLDVARQPLWSRVFETYGEDVYLCKRMGIATIDGYQGDDASDPYRVASCMKHFLGYSWSFTGKDRTTAYIPETQLREYFLPTFEAAVDAGSLSIMINSGDINGIPVHADKRILTDLLRTELKFDGVAVTDWEDIIKLNQLHKIAPTLKDAVKMAINAGIDMSMVPNDYKFSDLLLELVNEGEVSMTRIDESVRRILLMKQRLGLFEDPFTPNNYDYPLVASDSFVNHSYQIAGEAITLLKNNNSILPISKDKKVFVTGPMANSLILINGSWTRTWQGTDEQWDDTSKNTILDAIQANFTEVSFEQGCDINQLVKDNKAYNMARNSDIILACMGEYPSTEKPGDIHSLDLEEAQIEYVKALAKLGKPIVLVLVENRARIIRKIEPLCESIILAYQPSENGSDALADIISGEINPSGKLPITYPKYTNSLILYDHKYTDQLNLNNGLGAFDPQFEFGHGLSYTNFEYSDLKVNKTDDNESIHISVNVTNKGNRDGKESVLVFVSDLYASITPSVKRLRKFEKQMIKVGETRAFEFVIDTNELAFVNIYNQWVTEPGDYKISIGGLTESITL